MKSVWTAVSERAWQRIDGVTVFLSWGAWTAMDARGHELALFNHRARRYQPRRYKSAEAAKEAVRRAWPLSTQAWGSYSGSPQRVGLHFKALPEALPVYRSRRLFA